MEKNAIQVSEITLLYLCKTAAKKTLWLHPSLEPVYILNEETNVVEDSKEARYNVLLKIKIDEENTQVFCVVCDNLEDAEELKNNCVEWLNY